MTVARTDSDEARGIRCALCGRGVRELARRGVRFAASSCTLPPRWACSECVEEANADIRAAYEEGR